MLNICKQNIIAHYNTRNFAKKLIFLVIESHFHENTLDFCYKILKHKNCVLSIRENKKANWKLINGSIAQNISPCITVCIPWLYYTVLKSWAFFASHQCCADIVIDYWIFWNFLWLTSDVFVICNKNSHHKHILYTNKSKNISAFLHYNIREVCDKSQRKKSMFYHKIFCD